MKKNYYVIENGRATMHDKDFETKRDAIQYCINERRLDLKVGADNYYEVFNLLDTDRKCLYTTKDVIYRFMREEYPLLYPPKERKSTTQLFSLNKRCDFCTKFTNLRGSNNLCEEHYQKIVGGVQKKEIINGDTKIDIASAISMSIK